MLKEVFSQNNQQQHVNNRNNNCKFVHHNIILNYNFDLKVLYKQIQIINI